MMFYKYWIAPKTGTDDRLDLRLKIFNIDYLYIYNFYLFYCTLYFANIDAAAITKCKIQPYRKSGKKNKKQLFAKIKQKLKSRLHTPPHEKIKI